MTTKSKRRFDAELKILADGEHMDLLNELARETQTTRADQVRQAIVAHLRAHGMLQAHRP